MNKKFIYTLLILSVCALAFSSKDNAKANSVAHAFEFSNIYMENGDFSNDLTSWTGDNIGEIRDSNHKYWTTRKFFSVDKFLCGEVNEGLKGTLHSPSFTLGGEGYISMLLGGNSDAGYVRLVDETSNNETVLIINNNYFADPSRAWNMVYTWRQVDLSRLGHSMHFEIVDLKENGFGALIIDEIKTSQTAQEVINSFNAHKEMITNETEDEAGKNGTLEVYNNNYVLPILGETNYIVNPDFESGDMKGWNFTSDCYPEFEGGNPGKNPVYASNTFWAEAIPFNKNGNYFFSGFERISENQRFGIRSTTFTLGGSGFISFRMAGNEAKVVVKAQNGAVLAEAQNAAFADVEFPRVKDGCRLATMTEHLLDLSPFIGAKMYLEFHDTRDGGWGHLVLDNVVTYYETKPEFSSLDTYVNHIYGDYNEENIRIAAVNATNTKTNIFDFVKNMKDNLSNSGLCNIAADDAEFNKLINAYNGFQGVDAEFINNYKLTSESTIKDTIDYLTAINEKNNKAPSLSQNILFSTLQNKNNCLLIVMVIWFASISVMYYYIQCKKKIKKN